MKDRSALSVKKGINPPDAINKAFVKGLKNRRKQYSPEDYVRAILSHDRMMLSQAITLLESTRPDHQTIAQQIIERCISHSGNSFRIGITGVPGVGKSTFIESFGMHLIEQGKKVAILAIDPSSERTGGSILGDKTRMEKLSSHPNAFIRPSPSAGSLGGVARKTRESILLLEAAGFDTIIIETVGVGQSETHVHSMVDVFLLLMLAGAGDELQGIKRGIMEMADLITITKADGSNTEKANAARMEYQNALHLFPPTESHWIPRVLTCSSVREEGIETVSNALNEFERLVRLNGYFDTNRKHQAYNQMIETIKEQLEDRFFKNETSKSLLEKMRTQVEEGHISPYQAAKSLLENK